MSPALSPVSIAYTKVIAVPLWKNKSKTLTDTDGTHHLLFKDKMDAPDFQQWWDGLKQGMGGGCSSFGDEICAKLVSVISGIWTMQCFRGDIRYQGKSIAIKLVIHILHLSYDLKLLNL